MPNSNHLDPLFHPRSIAFVGITISNPEHWTRNFYKSTLNFGFEGAIYLVNPRGGEIDGVKVYQRLADIPGDIDYVISTVPAQASPGLVEECARKGVKAVHFCTSGFAETGEEAAISLEAQLAQTSRATGVRVLGPNCLGIYCPRSRVSFNPDFPLESGQVGIISQSGGNTISLIKLLRPRGVRFSKVVSYGNACDLNESDFLEYLADDSDTKVIGLYIEGVRDGARFRHALSKAAREKVVVLLKGGVTEEGARAASGHTGALAGNQVTWDALCKQLNLLRVNSLDELADVLMALALLPLPRGRNAALIGHGGGASVLITDQFGKRGLRVPPLPREIRDKLCEFIPLAGNMLRNPVDYSQPFVETGKMLKAFDLVARWEGIDFLIGYLSPSQASNHLLSHMPEITDGMLIHSRASGKPLAIVIEASIVPEESARSFAIVQKCAASGLPVFSSFASAANAISLVLSYHERRASG